MTYQSMALPTVNNIRFVLLLVIRQCVSKDYTSLSAVYYENHFKDGLMLLFFKFEPGLSILFEFFFCMVSYHCHYYIELATTFLQITIL